MGQAVALCAHAAHVELPATPSRTLADRIQVAVGRARRVEDRPRVMVLHEGLPRPRAGCLRRAAQHVQRPFRLMGMVRITRHRCG